MNSAQSDSQARFFRKQKTPPPPEIVPGPFFSLSAAESLEESTAAQDEKGVGGERNSGFRKQKKEKKKREKWNAKKIPSPPQPGSDWMAETFATASSGGGSVLLRRSGPGNGEQTRSRCGDWGQRKGTAAGLSQTDWKRSAAWGMAGMGKFEECLDAIRPPPPRGGGASERARQGVGVRSGV